MALPLGRHNAESGFSLVETLVTLAIFAIITTGVFSAFTSQTTHTRRETSVGHSEIEFNVAKGLLERDMGMAGYGLADDYNGLTNVDGDEFDPLAYAGENEDDDPDRLILMGTALGIQSQQTQGWSYVQTPRNASATPPTPPEFATWNDAREDLEADSRVIAMDPSTKTLLSEGNYWLFKYADASTNLVAAHPDASGTEFSSESRYLVYGLYGADSSDDDDDASLNPFYSVQYYLGGSVFPSYCADGTKSLERAESRREGSSGSIKPLLSCVLDFQVAFGLDRDENGSIETWDNGGASYLNGYTREQQRKRLKQVRVYLLVQSGRRDPAYTYPSGSIRVGETLADSSTTGRVVDLTAVQRQYRWKLVAVNVTPRNLR